eukprot:sb/3477802/
MSTTAGEAPIKQSSVEVGVTCKDGAAQMNAGRSETKTKCTNSGWSPVPGQLIQCVDGCTNLPSMGDSVSLSKAASTVNGAAPYNIGDIVSMACTHRLLQQMYSPW